MSRIQYLSAREILDSRGRPTVKAYCLLESGAYAAASVPSGASTGAAEALELRDSEARFGGLGCRRAVANIDGELRAALTATDFPTQASLDVAMIALDGTPNKSRLGANALLPVSLAFARAQSLEANLPLYEHLAALLGRAPALPQLTVNLYSGGRHAGGQVAFQDVLLVPRTPTVALGLETVYAVYRAAAARAARRYGTRELRADEGGLAPPFENVQVMLEEAVLAIRDAGYEPGREVALALDVASSQFFHGGTYQLEGRSLSSAAMIETLEALVGTYPIVSLEDGLSEEDWVNWPRLLERIGRESLVLGDDFLCTNPKRISRAVRERAANALLLKVNQIGTLSEAASAARLARDAGWHVTVSARSGETEDHWLADLAVAWGDQIKVGSITQSERLSKYNRLLEIEGTGEAQW